MTFTHDEEQLIAIYNAGTRSGTIRSLTEMRTYLEADETELRDLTNSALAKLRIISDTEFLVLDLVPEIL